MTRREEILQRLEEIKKEKDRLTALEEKANVYQMGVKIESLSL